MLYIASLNTGSNGNCFYLGNDSEAILIDAGISCRETEKRMLRLGLDIKKLKAIFISHEHGDHIAGASGLSKKYQLPVYITDKTFRNSNISIADELLKPFNADKAIGIGNLIIKPFKKFHDAIDPHSFMISCNDANVAVITDIGYACKEVVDCFKQCHAVFLESNYCDDMLEKGDYPYHLKQRIRSDEGHLSNKQALELFKQHRSPQLSHLILSHLSKNNNSPELVENFFQPFARTTTITVASRYHETALLSIGINSRNKIIRPSYYKKKPDAKFQLSLFE